MDTFKRLRTRKKSKGHADNFMSFADADNAYSPTSPSGHGSPGRSPISKSKSSETGRSNILESLAQSPDSRRADSLGRVQPMLIGISRPNLNSNSRPGTAGSLQNALDRAADSISFGPPLSPVSPAPPQSITPSRLPIAKGPRYIDILSIAGQSSMPTTTYNEDIADRNMDILSLTTEEKFQLYKPSSKYQEEVATRNSRSRSIDKASLDAISQAYERSPGLKDTNQQSDLVNDSYVHRQTAEQGSSRPRNSLDSPATNSRPARRSRDVPEQLPSIPQERSSEDFHPLHSYNLGNRPQDDTLINETPSRNYLPQPRIPSSTPVPTSPAPGSKHNSLGQDSRSSATDGNARPTRLNANSSATRSSDRSRQTVETGSIYSNRQSGDVNHAHRHLLSEAQRLALRTSGISTQSDRSAEYYKGYRPPSTLSTTSSATRSRIVGNRTVMDLTEDKSEALSVISYVGTPVLQHARWDSYQKLKPAIVETPSPQKTPPFPTETKQAVEQEPKEEEEEEEEEDKNEVIPNARWSSAPEPVLNMDQLARRSQLLQAEAAGRKLAETVNVPTIVPSRPLTPPRVLAFSTINTLTSVSPRASVVTLKKPERPEVLIKTSDIPVQNKRRSEDSLLSAKPDRNSQRSSARISPKIAPLVKVFADIPPEESQIKAAAVGIERQRSSSYNVASESKDTNESTADAGIKENPVMIQRKTANRPTTTHRSESLPLVTGSANETQGITTRDFATAPLQRTSTTSTPAVTKAAADEDQRPKPQRAATTPSARVEEKRKASGEKLVEQELTERKARIAEPEKIDKTPTIPKPKTKKSSSELKTRSKESSGKSKRSRSSERPRKPRSSGRSMTTISKSISGDKNAPVKQNSSAARKARPVSIFDEDAFKRKQLEAKAALLKLKISLDESFDELPTPLSPPESRASHGKETASSARSSASQSTLKPPQEGQAPRTNRSTGVYDDIPVKAIPPPLIARDPRLAKTITQTRPLNGIINSQLAVQINPLLGHIDSNNKPPPSPGEVSLSSFPLPTQRLSSDSHLPRSSSAVATAPVRRGSQSSRLSSASAFSIPFAMVPGRGSSLTTRIGPDMNGSSMSIPVLI